MGVFGSLFFRDLVGEAQGPVEKGAQGVEVSGGGGRPHLEVQSDRDHVLAAAAFCAYGQVQSHENHRPVHGSTR